jgi:hypothetical protein
VIPADWNIGPPPHRDLVEVFEDGQVLRVRAIWGSDGVLPHWESEDGDTLYDPSAFRFWRHIETGAAHDHTEA